MKLVYFIHNRTGNKGWGIFKNDYVTDLGILHFEHLIQNNQELLEKETISISEITLISPIPKPTSLRDAYAFRQHVEAGRKSRGLDMIPEYDKFPVFYYGNHNAISGPGEIEVEKDQSVKLDYELEIAAVIGKEGKNISVDEADDYIMGYTIMNDLSARALQKEEMKLSLGPAKGKDFLTTLGPYIITKDELEDKLIKGSDGDRYDLNMKAYLNGDLISQDNFKNITWTFAQIISRISNGTIIYPGDVIGSGTCATGCLLELNQTNNTNIWLQDGDEIKLEIDKLGSLVNTVKLI
ncbi:MAG: fumarylacetoacetase [Candidatus Marinimicrobia bacterium]|nr:fumarylacetoacetase [Candidatus Neomarinimicrobiota bacterium]